MEKFAITFHVDEADEAGAQEWLRRAIVILGKYRPELVSRTTGAGSFCEGHVQRVASQEVPAAAADTSPAKVLQMGPRE